MEHPALRTIPAVHRFTDDPHIAAYRGLVGAQTVRACVQAVLDEARATAAAGAQLPRFDVLRGQVLERLAAHEAEGLIRVINATGVLLHTNFGRAPLAESALAAVARAGAGYTNLEYDLERGERGSRHMRLAAQLCELSGAEAALVVNNCAAAVLLVLDTFAREREVVVSRGQLIEIGGGFRLPDVLRKSGATLVEVGTTNRTYGADYREAWTERTAMFMRSHPSNYRVEGFTAEVDAAALAALAKELGVISFEDLGSGALIDLRRFGLPHEPTLAEEIAAGIDLVAISGDKLLGGPQCGIIAGRAALVDRLRRNPLLRALRVDKLTVASLAATLALYLEPDRLGQIPFYAMLLAGRAQLLERAAAICAQLPDDRLSATVRETTSTVGGGSLPLSGLPSGGIAVRPRAIGLELFAQRLRRHRPPLIGLVEEDALVFDLRTVEPSDDGTVRDALTACACA